MIWDFNRENSFYILPNQTLGVFHLVRMTYIVYFTSRLRCVSGQISNFFNKI